MFNLEGYKFYEVTADYSYYMMFNPFENEYIGFDDLDDMVEYVFSSIDENVDFEEVFEVIERELEEITDDEAEVMLSEEKEEEDDIIEEETVAADIASRPAIVGLAKRKHKKVTAESLVTDFPMFDRNSPFFRFNENDDEDNC